ncbi:MAG: 2-amino-3,7-dideoxy-D-threo-hept-6-ulosonate synthase [Candidatus Aenigmatarchaeota archaeon]
MRKLMKKAWRLNKIIEPNKKRCLLVAFDHAVEHGPYEYEGINIDPLRIAKIAQEGMANALIVHPGAARYIKKSCGIPLIIKITGRTSLSPKIVQSITSTVEEAEYLGAVGVACTVYVGSEEEDRMLENLAFIKRECLKRGMPIIGFMYPRVKGKKKDDPRIVRYAARLGAELGVDIVKTYYTGSKESFMKVVQDSNFVPVVAAGGEEKSELEFLNMVRDIIDAGASGLAVGRNVWKRDNGSLVLKQIRRIVFGVYE